MKKKKPLVKQAERLASTISHALGTAVSIGIHTVVFVVSLSLPFWTPIEWQTLLLAMTTAISIEAIYLALFIQNTANGD